MEKRTWKILIISVCAIIAAVLIVSITVSVINQNDAKEQGPYDKVSYDIDQDDLMSFNQEKDGRFIVRTDYEARADLFLSKAVCNDDRDGDGNSTLKNCIDSLKKECPSDITFPEFLLKYLQTKFDYVPDPQQYSVPDWAVYPTELLSSKKGDCEDFAILTAAILRGAGYDCAIAVFSDHASALVAGSYDVSAAIDGYNPVTVQHNGRTYYIIDASFDGSIGYTDDAYSSESIKAIRYIDA